MRKNYHFILASCLLLLAFANNLQADEVPCLVFSGNSEEEHNLDLSVYKRIYFNDNSFIISSTNDPKDEDVELQYVLFNHLEFKDAIPTIISGIKEIAEFNDVRIIYNSSNRYLRIESGDDKTFDLAIYSISGNTVFSSKVKSNTDISIDNLVAGIYFAGASDGKNKFAVKFIIK